MPSFVFNTSVPTSSFPENIHEDLAQFVSEMLGKPMKFIAIHLTGDCGICFSGTKEPCGLGTLSCIGKLGLEENKEHTVKLMEFITAKLNISPDRMYISFAPMQGENVGWNHKTFAK